MSRIVTGEGTRRGRAIAALMAARSVTEAAQLAGVDRRTVHRWLQDDAFRAELAQAEGQLIDQAARRLLSGYTAALDVLEDVINNAPKDSDRRLAAVAWLQLLMTWRETRTIEERLASIERTVFGDGAEDRYQAKGVGRPVK